MATTVRIKLEIEVAETYTGDLGNPGKTHRVSKDVVFVSGTGTGQFNKVHSDIATAAPTNAVEYDVAGVVTDAQGAAITMAKLGMIYAENRGTTSGDLMYVGGDANSVPVFGAAADFVKVGPQGFALIVNPIDGWTVTGATGDIVEIMHQVGTWDHAVILAGRS
jgi:hypothetical protein